MSKKKLIRKGKNFAPVLSVALVATCSTVSLAGYQPPVYEIETEKSTEIEETIETEIAEEETMIQGSFDLADGVYKGVGNGYANTISVAVEIKNKSIVDIEVLSTTDDAAFLNRAKRVIDQIVNAQSYEVDTITGATYSSKGIINAVKNALTGEVDTSEFGIPQSGSNVSSGISSSIPKVEKVEEASAYKDGTYYGTGTGFGGAMKAEVVISGGQIVSIRIVENSDDSIYISSAAAVIDKIISTQSTNVDVVSGATYSSAGIIQAVRDALSQAATDLEDTENKPGSGVVEENTENETPETGTLPYTDGIYFGTAEGYLGDITVAVVIQEKSIQAVLVTESEDDEPFFSRAMDVVKNVIKQQNTEVDTVSGATYSSKGLLDAIKNALAVAEKVTNGENMTALESTIAEAEGLNQADYTELSWAILQIRLEDAKEARAFTVQEYVDLAEQKLRAAIDALEPNSDQENKDEANNDGEVGGEEQLTKYVDGTYEVAVQCVPDVDEDFESYWLSLSVTVENDKIIAITDITGDGDVSNDRYINWAANGRGAYVGVVAQILEKGTTEEIDTVSRATCSSKSIIEACEKALESALRQYNDEENNDEANKDEGNNDDENKDEVNKDEGNNDEENNDEVNNDEEVGSEEQLTKYVDGTYEAAVQCVPDEDEDFESYWLSLNVTVENDKIIAITDITGDGDVSNDRYINWAANGRGAYVGVVAQILEKGTTEEIDTVSRATCSSKSIIEACEKALESALRQ